MGLGDRLPLGSSHWGTCRKCCRTTWISSSDGLCTEPPYLCHFELPGEEPAERQTSSDDDDDPPAAA